MAERKEIIDFSALVERGDWEVVAEVLASLPEHEVAGRLEQLEAEQRLRAFALLPPTRRTRVYSALNPAKQNRALAQVLAAVR
ncbi:hypothetical protein CAI21_05415 [Alkalilimnicola ehrlichii]|uniref:Magnesium transporter MgtE intracellular domain-containing protein n=1 Tax=Alkalilimnicola ehrlichii TaxID=351052 RepID=A0A3E0X091_9GAMM|nr:hypothetical protein [Alkalilimnicola ehrlichii]RFA30489.1 hypothetical protein CAI21_05415 [Alkalilimnicola ehrlichii]RFA38039.1 hypothetical protein CAL65_06785 [Alkalilimnicola ehrlichii]